MKNFLAGLGTSAIIVMAIVSIGRWFDFKANCGDYLKLAGDAPTVELASAYLDSAMVFIESKHLTSGNSAYMFHTPKNDLGVWYDQLKGAKEAAASMLQRKQTDPASVTQDEQNLALIKIRDVVVDQGKKGIEVTAPDHITWFPNQWLILILWIVSIIVAAIGWFWIWEYNN